jgi:hypothetical protein
MNEEEIKNTKIQIDRLIERFHIQPVGCGYIDLITPTEFIDDFIGQLNILGIRITMLSTWCRVIEGHDPCGHGGPMNRFGQGWFSEVTNILVEYIPEEEVETNNKQYLEYCLDTERPDCFRPGFWLDVPESWKNQYSYKEKSDHS